MALEEVNPAGDIAQVAAADNAKLKKIALAAAAVLVISGAAVFGGVPVAALFTKVGLAGLSLTDGAVVVTAIASLCALYAFLLKPMFNASAALKAGIPHLENKLADRTEKLDNIQSDLKMLEKDLHSMSLALETKTVPLAPQARLNQTAQPSLAELAAKNDVKEAPASGSPRLSVSK